MQSTVKAMLLGLAVLGGTGSAPAAWAGCGNGAGAQLTSSDGTAKGNLFQRADYTTSTSAASIVGMWSFKFTSGSGLVDFGYQTWHSDGTELMNSGGRAPATENFCMGVWKSTGTGRYHLNHYALSYDAATGALNGRVNIKEDVVIAGNGATFSGPFTLDVYDPKSGALVQHIAGQATAERVAAN